MAGPKPFTLRYLRANGEMVWQTFVVKKARVKGRTRVMEPINGWPETVHSSIPQGER